MDNKDIAKEVGEYFRELRKHYLTGDSTEITYRTQLENFITSLNSNYNLTQEPQRIAGLGAPDFKAFYGSRKVGYIETKIIGEDLDKTLETEQLKKYITSIDNLILTNYVRFILVRKGEKVKDLYLFTISDLEKGHFTPSIDKIEMFSDLIEDFFGYQLPTINSAEELAKELSKRAKLLKGLCIEQLTKDFENTKNSQEPSSIYDFYEGIKELIKDISIEDCADAYAQTVTYGLFLAKKSHQGYLDRQTASSYIPKTVGIIKRIFLNISGEDFPQNISWIVDEIIDTLNATDLDEVLNKIDKRGKKDKDPILFFYEDFINYYEPERRKQLGVYYTPRPVVNFIGNSVHLVLKKHFDKPLGFAEDSVSVLDPAVGTGTFFWIAYLIALGELKTRGLSGVIFDKIRNHLLKDFYGFELLITPYVVSHLKLTDLLQRWHYIFRNDDRIQIYLTNTLEPGEAQSTFPFLSEIKNEIKTANQIKTEKQVLVVMGNPPYSGTSSNKGKWIDDLLKKGYTRPDGSVDGGYYTIDGKPLNEKNPKWLQDDYVKFLRFAQWKIDQNGEGVVGYITNHSYLDNPTFRGMRQSLLQSFDRIYILNLHGNSLKKEKCPDGSKDENVFDIRQGVAIGIFIKNKKFREKKVYYADLWGSREEKYAWLDRHTIENVEWQEIEPTSPYYFFVPKETVLEKENSLWRVTDIFRVSSVGIVTGRDDFVIDFDREELKRRILEFRDIRTSDEDIKRKYKLKEKKTWVVTEARRKVIRDNDWEGTIHKILYRPFDTRWIFYTDAVIERSRKEVMRHMLRENMGLVTVRQVKAGVDWSHCLVADGIIESSYISNKTSEINYLFPLYLYSEFDKTPNFDAKFTKFVSEKYGASPTPKEIFYYIYAVLYSPTYRKKYQEFLQYDFPRIPFVNDYEQFRQLSEIGNELVNLHLMRKQLSPYVKFDVPGSNVIKKVKYDEDKVWINDEQYFEGVPKEAWDFFIGGYQVLDKWLKSRKGRRLDSKDIEEFLQIVEIIRETIQLMERIDKIVAL